MTALCDEYSLDILETAFTLNTVIEWYEKGLITKKDTDGLESTWGNAEVVIELIHRIAGRQGCGDLLAEGPLRAAERIGQGAEKCIALHFQGYDVRRG